MAFRRLFLLVEGDDDQRFFERIVKPCFDQAYDWVHVWKYSQQKAERVQALLKSIHAMGAECLFACDLNMSPCVRAKKQETIEKYDTVDPVRIVVVCREIESWYLAGLGDRAHRTLLGSGSPGHTNSLGKEDFDQLVTRKFNSRIDCMAEILKRFDLETAKAKNRSFKYMVEKFKLPGQRV